MLNKALGRRIAALEAAIRPARPGAVIVFFEAGGTEKPECLYWDNALTQPLTVAEIEGLSTRPSVVFLPANGREASGENQAKREAEAERPEKDEAPRKGANSGNPTPDAS